MAVNTYGLPDTSLQLIGRADPIVFGPAAGQEQFQQRQNPLIDALRSYGTDNRGVRFYSNQANGRPLSIASRTARSGQSFNPAVLTMQAATPFQQGPTGGGDPSPPPYMPPPTRFPELVYPDQIETGSNDFLVSSDTPAVPQATLPLVILQEEEEREREDTSFWGDVVGEEIQPTVPDVVLPPIVLPQPEQPEKEDTSFWGDVIGEDIELTVPDVPMPPIVLPEPEEREKEDTSFWGEVVGEDIQPTVPDVVLPPVVIPEPEETEKEDTSFWGELIGEDLEPTVQDVVLPPVYIPEPEKAPKEDTSFWGDVITEEEIEEVLKQEEQPTAPTGGGGTVSGIYGPQTGSGFYSWFFGPEEKQDTSFWSVA